MAFVPAPSTVRCAVVYTTAGGNEAVNVLNFRKSAGGAITPADLTTVGLFVRNALNANWQLSAANTWQVIRLDLRGIDVQDGPTLSYDTGFPIVGSRTSPALPDNVALCVTKYSGFAGRSRRGRLFHGGLTEDIVTGNNVLLAYATIVEDCWQAVNTAAIANLYDEVIVSTISNGVQRVTAQLTEVATIVARDLRVDTMRGRLE